MKTRSIVLLIILNTITYGQSSSIRIIAPRENSFLEKGELVEIEWIANLIQGDINIYLSNHSSSSDILISTVKVNEKSYFWYVPDDFSDSDGVIAIKVVSGSDSNIFDRVFLR